MWAGGEVEVISPAMIGETLTRKGQVASVTQKTGRSGDLLFVGVDYEIHGEGAHIREHQDLVYRPAASGQVSRDNGSTNENDEWNWERTVSVDPTLLFRFSALTYNAHRIHYDREYATVTEGYPALVVHGPLQAILLADLAQRTQADFVPRTFSFRALAPAFDDHDLNLRARPRGDDLELAAFSSGRKTMTAVATR
jgi:3-methylfumaryl-CoA hydratase